MITDTAKTPVLIITAVMLKIITIHPTTAKATAVRLTGPLRKMLKLKR